MTSTAAALALADTAPTPLAERILDTLVHRIGKDARAARPHDWLNATCLTVRDDVIERWMTSTREAHAAGKKRVYYLSLEFLIGRLLRDALSNLGLTEEIAAALSSLGVELDLIEEIEPDAALGNGGLGRLAACFMESLSTLDLPAYGYGIRYVNGMFRQRIDDGWQVELPETWLAYGNPWEFQRRESAYPIGFGGEVRADEAGLTRWQPAETLIAEAFDTPVVGWRGARVNTLRLWNARAVDPIQLDRFNAGDHLGALADASRAETLTRVLYPADSNAAGQELRLRQEYFFSSASLQDIVRRHMQYVGDISSLPDHAAIQLNDTHPAVSVAELMRILLDQHDLAGDHIYKMDYELMLQQHCDSGADVTVACMEAPRAEATGFGVMAIDERGRKTDFVEKPADPPPMPGKPDVSLVSMGIYVFHTRFLFDQLKRDAETPGSSRDFGKDIIPHLVGLEDTVIDANEAALASGVATGFQFDGVTPEALDRVLGRVLRLYARPDAWRAVQRQGMRADVSWARSGRRYADLYAELLNHRTPA